MANTTINSINVNPRLRCAQMFKANASMAVSLTVFFNSAL
jgi:hypothetical protein